MWLKFNFVLRNKILFKLWIYIQIYLKYIFKYAYITCHFVTHLTAIVANELKKMLMLLWHLSVVSLKTFFDPLKKILSLDSLLL